MAATTESDAVTAALSEVTLEDIGSRHRKERKELQAKIQALKKNAPKSDKKKRKEVLEEIARMENEQEQRQAQELSEANKSGVHSQEQPPNKEPFDAKADNTKELSAEKNNKCAVSDVEAEQPATGQRVSKAQKRRDKKSLEAKQRAAEILACQEDSKTAPKALETNAINKLLKQRQLMMQLIASDGDCLYNAVRHQLQLSGLVTYSVAQLREETANYIAANKDDLICYMTNTNTGDLLSDAEFNAYCESVRNTPAWGGQIELKALSSILKVPIEVLQATGTPTLQGVDEFAGPNLVITYHRHMYSLGEHYNSTKPWVENKEEDANETMA